MHRLRANAGPRLRHGIAATCLAGTLALVAPAAGFAAELPPTPASETATGSATTATSVIDSFDGGSPAWYVASGPGSVSQSGGRLKLTYNFGSSTQIQVAPLLTHADIPGLPRSVCVDIQGDGSWNVAYLQLRDATGEIFHYRLGNLSTSGVQPYCVSPGTDAAAATIGGNADGIPDLPLAAYRLVLDKNPGGLKSSGTIYYDNLRATYEPWSALRSDSSVIAPSAGQSTTLRIGLQQAASFSVTLQDSAGRSASWSGSCPGGGVDVTHSWNGRSSSNALMSGSIRARLVINRDNSSQTVAIPYLVGLAARYEPASPGSIVGVNSFIDTINTNQRAAAETEASLMEAAYVRVAREEFDWDLIEPRNGWFEWAKFDQAVAVLQAHNISVIGKLVYSATWASSAPSGTPSSSVALYPPTNPADYAAYAAAVVHRYKSKVHVWEIWNEENLSTFWKPSPSASAYTALLKAAYQAIKAEDPTATVLVGGLAESDIGFLSGIRAAGGWNYFDGVAIHTYVNGDPEVGIAEQWLEEMKAYVNSVGAKSIWVTEVGWSTYSGSGVSQQAQAEYLSRFYMMAAKEGVAGVCWFQFQARSSSTTSVNDNYAVVNYNGTTKPAYNALMTIGNALDQGTVLGDADPNASHRTTVDSTATPSGWSVSPLSGGSASLSTSSSVTHGSSTSMALSYTFTSSSQGAELKRNLTLPGSPTSVAVWIKGDGSANPVFMKLTDATGEVFQARIGSLMAGWQRLVMRLDGAAPSWSSSGGDHDGVVDYPVRLTSILVFRGTVGHLTGTDYFGGVETETGTPVRGMAVSRQGGVEQLLYTLAASANQAVPVTSQTWTVSGSTVTKATVTNGSVTVGLSRLPVALLSAPEASPSTIYIFPDNSHTSAVMKWPTADGYSYSLDVVDSSGRTLTTLVNRSPASAGLASETWNGTVGGRVVSLGTYKLGLNITGVDGRSGSLATWVTVAAGTPGSTPGIGAPGQPTGVYAVAGDRSATISWTAPDDGGSSITGYTVTASPGGLKCQTTGATYCTISGLTNGVSYTFSVTATNAVGTGPASNPSAPVKPAPVVYSTYHPIDPARLLDSRVGNGLSGKFVANTPRTFQVTGRAGIPQGATAVTGNLTVTGSTAGWAVFLGPDPQSKPTTSTINFTTGQVTANALTVALSPTGTLSATFMSNPGNTTDLVFDVTGYFTASDDGATFHAIDPVRLLDTRVNNGLSGKFVANTPRTFLVAGRQGIPSNVVAVTGNLTVANPTNAWAVYLGPVVTAKPTTSTVNFVGGQVRGNSVTVALDKSGYLSATYMSTAGNTTDLVFDVTGYYTADSSGARFVAISPSRLVDTRVGNGLTGSLRANTPETFTVAGRGGVPANAEAISGNATVVDQTYIWAIYVGPYSTSSPTTSTVNFDRGEVRANSLSVALSGTGSLSVTYMSTAGNHTDFVLDVTGYYAP